MALMASAAGIRTNTVVLTFTLIAGLVVFLRLFTRGVLLRKTGIEDVFIALAMVLSVGLNIAIAIQVQNGLGNHIFDLSSQDMIATLKAFWASVWMYNLALTTTKISILLQYLRIFPTRPFRIVCCVILGFVVVYGTWTLFNSIFLCFPIDFFWNKSISGGKCLNQNAIWFSNAGVNIAQDIIILVLPMPVLRGLGIPIRQKKALIVVFAIGGLVCLVSIIRLQSLVAISNSKDPTFDNPPAAILSSVETNVGILCACLPALRPLLSAMMPAYFPEGSRYANVRTHDEERPRHIGHPSASSRPYPAHGTPKFTHSRNGSSSTRTFSRHESELEDMHSPQPTHKNTGRGTNRFNQQAPLSSVHPQHGVHPLRMSPFSPPIPEVPQLPENMVALGSIDSTFHSLPGPRRTARTPLFHKPLPITPFPVMTGA